MDLPKDGNTLGFGMGDPMYFADTYASIMFNVASASSVANTFLRRGAICNWYSYVNRLILATTQYKMNLFCCNISTSKHVQLSFDCYHFTLRCCLSAFSLALMSCAFDRPLFWFNQYREAIAACSSAHFVIRAALGLWSVQTCLNCIKKSNKIDKPVVASIRPLHLPQCPFRAG